MVPPSWLIQWLQRCGLLLGSLILCLAGLEATVRVFDLGPQVMPVVDFTLGLSDNPVLQYELLPRAAESSDPLSPLISSRGHRDREYPVASPEGTFRIVCVGDSICYGYGVKRKECFSTRLEDLLNRLPLQGPLKFEVLNLGVPGYNATQVIEYLRSRGLDYQPDLVMYAYCLNDPQGFSLELAALRAQLNTAQSTYRDALVGRAVRGLNRSRAYLLIRYLIQARTAEGREHREAYSPHDDRQVVAHAENKLGAYFTGLHNEERRWLTAFDELAALTSTRDLPAQVVTFPLFSELDHYPLAGLHRTIAAALARRSLSGLDLLQVYLAGAGAGPVLNVDPLHPSPAGHQLAAAAMLCHLVRQGQIPGADPEAMPSPTGATPSETARLELSWTIISAEDAGDDPGARVSR